eukprot:Colp12_sorted_trinity150504_noHs@23870
MGPRKFVIAGLLLLGLLVCSHACDLEVGKEYPPEGEEDLINLLSGLIAQKIKSQLPREVLRDAHAKTTGCTRAKFIIDPDVPERARYGLFANPGKSYDAWVRFSNGVGFTRASDKNPDGRGLAIKVLNVPGKKLINQEDSTQDFINICGAVNQFFIANITDYLAFFKDQQGFLANHTIERQIAQSVGAYGASKTNPVSFEYVSMVPYKLGPNAIRFSFKPCTANPVAGDTTDDNLLRHALVSQLDPAVPNNPGACFNMYVRFQEDACKQPIEDPRIPWDTPDFKVATLQIPAQYFDNANQNAFCDNLSFSPWHSLPEHRPLGGVSRTRRTVYLQASGVRYSAGAAGGNYHVTPTATQFCSNDCRVGAECPKI